MSKVLPHVRGKVSLPLKTLKTFLPAFQELNVMKIVQQRFQENLRTIKRGEHLIWFCFLYDKKISLSFIYFTYIIPLFLTKPLTEIGAIFKMAQNTFNIKWRMLPVALGLQFLVDSLDIY